MAGAWALRIPNQRAASSSAPTIVVSQVLPEGSATEVDVLEIAPKELCLRDVVEGQIALGRLNLVVDLGSIPHLDSVGIGEIVSAFVHAEKSGATLALANLAPRVQEVVTVVGLPGVIPIFGSIEEAARPAAPDHSPDS